MFWRHLTFKLGPAGIFDCDQGPADAFEDREPRSLLPVVACRTEACDFHKPGSLGLRVMRELDRLIEVCGHPRRIASDSGTEFTSNAILA